MNCRTIRRIPLPIIPFMPLLLNGMMIPNWICGSIFPRRNSPLKSLTIMIIMRRHMAPLPVSPTAPNPYLPVRNRPPECKKEHPDRLPLGSICVLFLLFFRCIFGFNPFHTSASAGALVNIEHRTLQQADTLRRFKPAGQIPPEHGNRLF